MMDVIYIHTQGGQTVLKLAAADDMALFLHRSPAEADNSQSTFLL
jgi:hypothetical protein